MNPEDLRKAKDRKDQYKKINDIAKILGMQSANLLKHEFLKYRKERLLEELQWFKDQSLRMRANNQHYQQQQQQHMGSSQPNNHQYHQ